MSLDLSNIPGYDAAECIGAHYIRISYGNCELTLTGHSEEELFEFELARLASRQCREMFEGDNLNVDKFTKLFAAINTYAGLFVPTQPGGTFGFMVKPDYFLVKVPDRGEDKHFNHVLDRT